MIPPASWGVFRGHFYKLKKELEKIKQIDLCLEKARYRSSFIEKKEIIDKLKILDKHLRKKVEKQHLTAKLFFKVILSWFAWYEIPYFILISITYYFPGLRRTFNKTHANFVIGRAVKLNGILREYNLGTEVITNKEAYQYLYQEIMDIQVGLPPILIVKIDTALKLSKALHGMKLLNLTPLSWRNFKYKRILKPMFILLRSGLNGMMFTIDNTIAMSMGEIAKELEDYYMGLN